MTKLLIAISLMALVGCTQEDLTIQDPEPEGLNVMKELESCYIQLNACEEREALNGKTADNSEHN